MYTRIAAIDVATLGIQIDSSQAKQAATDLDSMTAAGARAEMGSDRVAKKAQEAADSIGKISAQAKGAATGFESTGASASACVAALRAADEAAAKTNNSFSALQAAQKGISEALKLGAISANDYASASASIAARAAALNKGLEGTTAGVKGAEGAMKGLSFATGGVTREIGVLFGEAARGNYTRMEGSLVTLANRTGALQLAFSGVGAAVAAGVVVFGGAIALFVHASTEINNFNKALIATGNYAGTNAAALRAQAEEIGQTTGHYLDAEKALTALANSGKFAGSSLYEAGRGAIAFADVTGQSVDKAVAAFEKIAKEPTKEIRALDEQFHFLSVSQLEQIANLERMGDKAGATTLAVKALSEAMVSRDAEITSKLTGFAALYREIAIAVGGFADAMSNLIVKNEAAIVSFVKLGYTLNPIIAAMRAGAAARDFIAAGPEGNIHQVASPFDGKVTGSAETISAATQATREFTIANNAADEILKKVVVDVSDESKKLEDAAIAHTNLAKVRAKEYADLRELSNAVGNNADMYAKDAQKIRDSYAPLEQEAIKRDQATAALKHHGAAIDYTSETLKRLNDITLSANSILEGPVARANDKYLKQLAQIDEIVLKAREHHEAMNVVLLAAAKAREAANAELQREKDLIAARNDLLREAGSAEDQLLKKYSDEADALTLTNLDRIKVNLEMKREQEMKHALASDPALLNLSKEERQAYIDKAKASADFQAQLQEEVKLNNEAGKEWQTIWSQSLNNILTTSGNVWSRLKAGFSNLVDSIIQYFTKLSIINPILNAMFGGAAGFSLLPTMANAMGGGGQTALAQTGGAIADAVSSTGAAGGASGGAGGLSSLLTSPSTWLSAGKSFFSGFSSLWGGSSTGGSSFLGGGIGQNFMGPLGPGQAYGYTPSLAGNVIGIGGGILAGIGEYKAAGGGLAGLAGGAAYGLGTLTATGAIGGVLSGAGAAAGAEGSLGAVGLGSIPVVGWVALAAMALNMITGGGLFGTSYKPTGNVAENLTVGPGGATIGNSAEESKKKPLFGGRSWTWKDFAATADEKSFADSVTLAMHQVAMSAATALGTDIGDLVSGSFKQVTDKSGKIISQVSTVLGQTFSEPIADFVKRLQALNVGAAINKARGDMEASTVLAGYSATATAISDAAQMILAAQVDIKHGTSLLGSDHSLVDINKLVSELAQSGETLVQTYQRLQTESKTLQDAFNVMGFSIGKTGADFVKFADAAAQAAGGVNNLTSMLQSFQQAYYSPQEIAKTQANALRAQATAALSGIGEAPGISMADFRKDYEAHLPTFTPEQLVAWTQAGVLLAQATAAETAYNKTLTDAAAAAKLAADQQKAAQLTAIQNYASIVTQVQNGLTQLMHPASAFQTGLLTISQALASTEAQLQAAAKAAGMAAAREQDLTLVRQYAALQAQVLATQLVADSEPLVTALFGTGAAATSASSSLNSVATGLQNVQSAAQQFRNSMLLNSQLSPLNVQEQYDEALKQLSVDGSSQTAQTALTLARKLMASGDDYKKAFDLITGMVKNNGSTATGGVGGGSTSASATTQLTDSQRLSDAQKLAQNVADLFGYDKSIGKDQTYAEIAKQLGFNLDQLGQKLGLQGNDLNKYLDSLQAKTYNLTDMAGMLDKTVTQPIVDAIYKALGLITDTHVQGGVPGSVQSMSAANDPTAQGWNPGLTNRITRRGGHVAPDVTVPTTPGAPTPPGSREPIGPQHLEALGNKVVAAVLTGARTTASGADAMEAATHKVANGVGELVNIARNPIDGARSVRTITRVA